MQFAPDKYELMHFSRRRKFDMEAPLVLGSVTIYPSKIMRVLGVFLDPRLRWKGHLDAIAGRMRSQVKALTRTTALTWGLPLEDTRRVYTMVIRPALTYGAVAWHQPQSLKRQPDQEHRPIPTAKQLRLQGIAANLATIQNSCLRVVAGAYKATPITTLEAETYVPPLELYLDSVVARATHRMREIEPERGAEIIAACRRVRRSLHRRGQNRRKALEDVIHPKPLPATWVTDWATQGLPALERNNDQIPRTNLAGSRTSRTR